MTRFDDRFRCTAKASSTGQRCKRAAAPGASVCRSHGGAAPQVRAAGERRLAMDGLRARIDHGDLGALLDELHLEIAGQDPSEILLEAVVRATAMMRLFGGLVGALDPHPVVDAYIVGEPRPGVGGKTGIRWEAANSALYGPDHQGDGKPHVLVSEYLRWTQLAASTAKDALAAGVDERRVRLAEAQSERIAEILRLFVGSLLANVVGQLPNERAALEGVWRDAVPGLLREAITMTKTEA